MGEVLTGRGRYLAPVRPCGVGIGSLWTQKCSFHRLPDGEQSKRIFKGEWMSNQGEFTCRVSVTGR